MDLSTTGKKLLLPPWAGVEVLQRHDLYCEDRYNWATGENPALLERVLSGHAPIEWEHKGEEVRLNVGSPDAAFRQWSFEKFEWYIRTTAETPRARLVVMHSAPRYWVVNANGASTIQCVGEYGLVVENIKRLARLAGELGIRLMIENNCTRWDEIAYEEEYDHAKHFGHVRQYFTNGPEEWAQIIPDVDEPALGLCMDTSHATNYSQRFPLEQRPGIYHKFIDLAGDRLWHVHWNDNWMHTREGRKDPHLDLGKGTVPRDVHERLWNHPTVGTMLLEHFRSEETMVEELAFISALNSAEK